MKAIYQNVDKWDELYNAKSDEEQYDFVTETLKQPLSKSFIDKLDLGMVLVDIKCKLEDEKQFDKLFKLIETIQNYHPELYRKEYHYFDEFLIEYFLFKNEKEKLSESLSRFEKDPVEGVDTLLPLHKKLLLYGYNDLAVEIAKKTYKPLDTSPDLIEGSGMQLAISMLYYLLEQHYEEFLKTKIFNCDEFIKQIAEFDFSPDSEFINPFKKGLTEDVDDKETICQQFFDNRKNYMYILDCYFLKYMRQNKQMSFTCSSIIWEGLWNFWSKQSGEGKHKPEVYFSLNKDKLEKYLVDLMGTFLTNKSETIAILWGAIYAYDFLLSIELISEKGYDDVRKIISSLKVEFIRIFGNDLWKFNFVHKWKLPNAISQEEFNAESQIFVESLDIKSEVGDFFDNSEEVSTPKTESSEQIVKSKVNEVKQRKVGRNEPCPCGSGKKYKKCCGNLG